MNQTKLITIGLLGSISVALGALGAHFLKSKLETGLITPDQLIAFDTAAKYQMYHAIAMFGLFLYSKNTTHKYLNWSFNCFLIGVILFSGSIYLLSTKGLLEMEWLRFLGPITPIGGLFFITGWIFIVLLGFTKEK